MPYEISFTSHLEVPNVGIYINECCWGGDVVRDRLLPLIKARSDDIETEQEDWGSFIWFRKGSVRLAIDIFCDQPNAGGFRIRLTERKKRFLVLDSIVDGPDLEGLLELVKVNIEAWAGACRVERVHE